MVLKMVFGPKERTDLSFIEDLSVSRVVYLCLSWIHKQLSHSKQDITLVHFNE